MANIDLSISSNKLEMAKLAMGVQQINTILRPEDAFLAWYLDRLPKDTTVKPFFGLITSEIKSAGIFVVGRYCGSSCNGDHDDNERCCQYPDDWTRDHMYGIGPISADQITAKARLYDCYVVVPNRNINMFGYYLPSIVVSGRPSPAYFTPNLPRIVVSGSPPAHFWNSPVLDDSDIDTMIMATGVLTEFMPADIARVCFEFLVELIDPIKENWGDDGDYGNFVVRRHDPDDDGYKRYGSY